MSREEQEGGTQTIPTIEDIREALIKINNELRLGFSGQDIEYYANLFETTLNVILQHAMVKLFDMRTINSKHLGY